MRVCLIQPPSGFLLDERVFVSLGLLKVAAALEQAGHEVEVLDLAGVDGYENALAQHVGETDAAVFGITATTPQMPAALRVAEGIRSLRPAARIILGGPHVTLCYAARKVEVRQGRVDRAHRACADLESRFDVLIAGDGERAMLGALKVYGPKVIDADDPNGKLFLSGAELDGAPMPARHLVDMDSYRYEIEGYRATSLIAQLGCPFHCGFCGGRSSASLRRPRQRSSQAVVDEIEHLWSTYGYRGYMLYDDELNVNRGMIQMMEKIADFQAKIGEDFRLRGFVKAELLTPEQARAMYRAGFRWLLCGFEAADPRILTNIRKVATLEDNTRAVEIAKDAGLKVKALMSIGHPGESCGSVEAVRDWLIRMQVDEFDCAVITTYPGTPYYDEAVPSDIPGVYVYTQPQTGDRLYAEDVDYLQGGSWYKGIPGEYRSFVFTDHLGQEALVHLRDKLERDVREALGIPFNASRSALRFEHSMGQQLPDYILRQAR